MASEFKMGKANYGKAKEFKKRNYFQLKDGQQTYRVLPPMGELADEGKWSMFYNVHFGYKNSEGKMRVFQSPEVKNRKTKMIEVEDAAKKRIDMLKAELEKAKMSGNAEAQARLEKLVGMKGLYSLDNNHHMNVIDANGNIGVLKLRHRAKLALEAAIRDLEANGIDPLSPEEGRYFVFTREGFGLDTTFRVSVLKEKLNIEGVGMVERDVVHKLTPDLIARLKDEASDLSKLFKRPTAEEVARIVAEADVLTGVSKAIDEIFKDTKEAAATTAEVDVEIEEEEMAAPAAAVAAVTLPSGTNTSKPAAVSTAPAQVTVKVTQTPAPVQQTSASDKMSSEEFLKSLGL